MKIGIDCRFWSQTGVGRYTRNLVKELSRIDSKNNYVLFVLKSDEKEIKDEIRASNFEIVRADIKWHSISEQIKFPRLLNKYNLDLVHFPYFSHPIFYKKPFIITIHDLIINHFSTGKASTLPLAAYGLKLMGYRQVLSHAAKKSYKIIAPLNFVKNDLIRTLNVPASKIEVTNEGFDSLISKGKVSDEVLNATKTPYFLYVGNAYPHKNLIKLLTGFYRAKLNNINLILVGREDYFYKKLEREKFPNLVFLHEVSDSELYHLYSSSIGAVSASLMEGFGLLPLEALSCGTIPVISDIPAFGEVCGDAAIYFDPQNAEDIAKKIAFALELSKSDREKILKKGKELISQYSWEKMAAQTLKIYESSHSV